MICGSGALRAGHEAILKRGRGVGSSGSSVPRDGRVQQRRSSRYRWMACISESQVISNAPGPASARVETGEPLAEALLPPGMTVVPAPGDGCGKGAVGEVLKLCNLRLGSCGRVCNPYLPDPCHMNISAEFDSADAGIRTPL